ncbi:MAG: hypothetical protein Q7K45_02335, partial [Nanoarchaeota archaeon]|nr:hypothetical protein [Nanoarchaeota archaeon]
MKANFPAEFMAALLTSDQGNIDRVAIEIDECRQMNMEVLPPDVNESFASFTVIPSDDGKIFTKIRFGLSAIKNVGDHIVSVIVSIRGEQGPFLSLIDFLERVQDKDLNKKSLESLIRCGALDRFGDRNEMLYNMDRLLAFNKQTTAGVENKQASLFGAEFKRVSLTLEAAPPLDERVKLSWEKELLGLYLSEHPLKSIQYLLNSFVIPCRDAKNLKNDAVAKVCGIVTQSKKIMTKKNEPMLFVKIEDLSDSLEIIVFPSILKDTAPIWNNDSILAIEGRISFKDNEAKIICSKVKEIDDKMIEYLKSIAPEGSPQKPIATPVIEQKQVNEVEEYYIYEPD